VQTQVAAHHRGKLRQLGLANIAIERVVVTALQDSIFYAVPTLRIDGQPQEVYGMAQLPLVARPENGREYSGTRALHMKVHLQREDTRAGRAQCKSAR
jgi:hypothetical protein